MVHELSTSNKSMTLYDEELGGGPVSSLLGDNPNWLRTKTKWVWPKRILDIEPTLRARVLEHSSMTREQFENEMLCKPI